MAALSFGIDQVVNSFETSLSHVKLFGGSHSEKTSLFYFASEVIEPSWKLGKLDYRFSFSHCWAHSF